MQLIVMLAFAEKKPKVAKKKAAGQTNGGVGPGIPIKKAKVANTGCSGKKCVLFPIHCNPSLTYIAVREPSKLSMQWVFTVTPIGW